MTAEDWDALNAMRRAGDVAGARELIFRGGKVSENVRDVMHKPSSSFDGRSVLHYLAMTALPRSERDSRLHELIVLLRELVDVHGADVNRADSMGSTPLHIATMVNSSKLDDDSFWSLAIVQVMLDAGADSDPIAQDGVTPLAWAIYAHFSSRTKARAGCVELLLDCGANLNRAKAYLKGLPPWVEDLVKQRRENAGKAVVTVLGIKRFGRSHVMNSNAKDVIRLIADQIWLDRYNPAWKPPT